MLSRKQHGSVDMATKRQHAAEASEEASIEEGDEVLPQEAVYVRCGGDGSFCGKVH